MDMKCAHKNGRGLGAAARHPVDQGQSPGWGPVYFYFTFFLFNFGNCFGNDLIKDLNLIAHTCLR